MTPSEIEGMAANILKRHGITEPPVPIEAIAESQGALIVRNYYTGHESGFALSDGARKIIGVNTATSPRRQRFTVAHELGHLLLHGNRKLTTDYSVLLFNRNETSSLGTEEEEVAANRFAAAVLMPREFVRVELKRELDAQEFSSKDELIAKLARTFMVSIEAMGYRLINLNIITA